MTQETAERQRSERHAKRGSVYPRSKTYVGSGNHLVSTADLAAQSQAPGTSAEQSAGRTLFVTAEMRDELVMKHLRIARGNARIAPNVSSCQEPM